jgi:acyl carrier protein
MEAVLESDVPTMASALAELVIHHDEETTRKCLELLGLDSTSMVQVLLV